MYVDSHCHLDFPELSSRLDEVLARMRDNRVDRALCASVSLEDSMIAMQKASVTFQAAVQVRNKVVAAYQDIMNLPI